MNGPREHSAYFHGFKPECARPAGWSVSDWTRLQKYGRWFEALIRGDLTPTTDEQRRFVALFRGEEMREPVTRDENLWKAYQLKLKAVPVERPKASGLTLRVHRSPPEPARLANGDDDNVYISRRKRR